MECRRVWHQGVVLPVNPSTLRVWNYLQKFDPLGDPLESVRHPLGKPDFSAAKERIERKDGVK